MRRWDVDMYEYWWAIGPWRATLGKITSHLDRINGVAVGGYGGDKCIGIGCYIAVWCRLRGDDVVAWGRCVGRSVVQRVCKVSLRSS
jgi:hypothetical protein